MHPTTDSALVRHSAHPLGVKQMFRREARGIHSQGRRWKARTGKLSAPAGRLVVMLSSSAGPHFSVTSRPPDVKGPMKSAQQVWCAPSQSGSMFWEAGACPCRQKQSRF